MKAVLPLITSDDVKRFGCSLTACSEVQSPGTIADEPASTDAPLGIDEPNEVWNSGCKRVPGRQYNRRPVYFLSEGDAWRVRESRVLAGIWAPGEPPKRLSFEAAVAKARAEGMVAIHILDGSGHIIEEYPLGGGE